MQVVETAQKISPEVRAPFSDYQIQSRWHTPCYEKLNDLEWVDGFAFRCFGVNFGVRVSDAALIPTLIERLPEHAKQVKLNTRSQLFDCVFSLVLGGRAPGSRVRAFHMCYQNHTQVARSHELEDALIALDSHLNLWTAMVAKRRIFVHAGAVSWKGRALLLPGQSLSGKSTLTAELVRQGATYYSDDYAVLDNAGRVFPYLRPISMRKTRASKQVPVTVESLGGVSAKRPAPVALIALCQFKENARWCPQVLSPGGGVFGMLANAPAARVSPTRVLKALTATAERAQTIRTYRGEAAEVASLLLHRLERLPV